METVSESAGTRLGRMLASEPELTRPLEGSAGREFSERFASYLMADGFDWDRMATRMERLKFEAIVSGKTIGEVLPGMTGP